MKWILLTVLLSYSLLTKAQISVCNQVTKLYEKVRAEQRLGYESRRGNWLNCVKRNAHSAIRKYCKTKQGQMLKSDPVVKNIRDRCKVAKR